MVLSDSACVLELYKYDDNPPRKDLFGDFHSTICSRFTTCGIVPTYIAAEGKSYPGKFTKFKGRTHNRMIKSQFADISILSIAANPPESDAPGYDAFVCATLVYSDFRRELELSVGINESFIKCHSDEYHSLLHALMELGPWDFGYGFAGTVGKQSVFYALGFDNRKPSPEEEKARDIWGSAPGEVRVTLLRDIYAYNILNETQLNAFVNENTTLREFAQRQPNCSLTRLTDYGLYLWQLPDAEVARVKEALAESPIFVS